jgi:hypothetical protein
VTLSDSFSDHPVDRLIVRIARGEVTAASADVDAIVQRVASAPFNRRPVRVPRLDRGLVYGNIVIGRIANSLELHLAKRVRGEHQWAEGTTTDEYLRDLRTAIQQETAQILVYERSGDIHAAAIATTSEIVPVERRGNTWLPHLLTVYSTRHGILVTGYMFSDIQELNLPEIVRWLR